MFASARDLRWGQNKNIHNVWKKRAEASFSKSPGAGFYALDGLEEAEQSLYLAAGLDSADIPHPPTISRYHFSPYGPVRQIFVYVYLQPDCFSCGLDLERPSPDMETETTLSSGKWSQGYSDSWSSARSLSSASPVGREISDFPSQSPTLLPGFCSFLSLNVPSSPRLAL